jgi:ATPase subunit of ABC transporter with duplicated ATPase domains
MILDEPTNHLDIDSREVLEETLIRFDGTLLFVSHDRYFINKIADKILAIEDNCIQIFSGNFADYVEDNEKILTLMETEEKSNSKVSGVKKSSNNNLVKTIAEKASPLPVRPKTASLKKLEEMEQKICDLEEQLKNIENLMNEYNSDMIKLNELFHEKTLLEKELRIAYEMWEEMQLI